MTKRRNFSDRFKATVALEALRGDKTVQDIVGLAFLSPEVLKQVIAGTQPVALTTDHLIKTGFPVSWSDQHAAFAALD